MRVVTTNDLVGAVRNRGAAVNLAFEILTLGIEAGQVGRDARIRPGDDASRPFAIGKIQNGAVRILDFVMLRHRDGMSDMSTDWRLRTACDRQRAAKKRDSDIAVGPAHR